MGFSFGLFFGLVCAFRWTLGVIFAGFSGFFLAGLLRRGALLAGLLEYFWRDFWGTFGGIFGVVWAGGFAQGGALGRSVGLGCAGGLRRAGRWEMGWEAFGEGS